MKFEITYRGPGGALKEDAIEAASRAEALAECRRRGISPMRIVELSAAKMAAVPVSSHPRGGAQGRKSAANGNSAFPHFHNSIISQFHNFTFLILAALLIAAIGAWWWLGHDKVRPSQTPAAADGGRDKARPSQTPVPPVPRVAARASATNAASAKPKKKRYEEMTREEKVKWFEEKYGDNVPENLKTTLYFLKNPPTATYRPPPTREEAFKRHSEKSIAGVLLLEPGTFVMRRTTFDESFDADFKKSLEEPIEDEEGDSDETKALKQAVREAKAEMAERMAKGEKPSDIMNEAMETAYELGKYTRELEAMLREVVDDRTKTEKDVEDFLNAANEMLREKGAKEMEMPSLVKRQIRMRISEKRRQRAGR